MTERICLVHYHEIGLKGKNRSTFENQLVTNLHRALRDFPVTDISRILDLNQTTVSHQLRFLKDTGMVKTDRHGKIIFYSLANDLVNDVMLKGVEFLGY